MKNPKIIRPYPNWICFECGNKYGRTIGQATWHTGNCGVCGKEQGVTEPRDFDDLRLPEEFEEETDEINEIKDFLRGFKK